jgi:hypothetical protein
MNIERNWILDNQNNVISILSNVNWKLVSPYTWKTFEEINEEYSKDLPKNRLPLKACTKEEAIWLIEEIESINYNIWLWEKSTKERFTYRLEVLPPEKHLSWEFVWKKYEIFRMSEYQTSDITTHFLKVENNYYKWNFRTREYEKIGIEQLLLPTYFLTV